MENYTIHQKKKKTSKLPWILGGVGALGLGGYAAIEYMKDINDRTSIPELSQNLPLENPNDIFKSLNITGINEDSDVYESQREAFEMFEEYLNKYNAPYTNYHQGETPTIIIDNTTRNQGGFISPEDIKNGSYTSHIRTEVSPGIANNSSDLLDTLIHEDIHLRHMPPEVAETTNYISIDVDIHEGEIEAKAVHYLLIGYGENQNWTEQLFDPETGEILVSVALNELATEFVATEARDNIFGDGNLTIEDFNTNSMYYDEVKIFTAGIQAMFEDLTTEEMANSFAYAMTQHDGVEALANKFLENNTVQDTEPSEEITEQFLYEFAYDHLNMMD